MSPLLILFTTALAGTGFWWTSTVSIQRVGSGSYWRGMGARALPAETFIAQQTWQDCGHAALAELLNALGIEAATANAVKTLLPQTSDGVSIGQLRRAASGWGVSLSAHRPHNEWIDTRPPYIILLKRHHYITVREVQPNAVVIADPAGGVFTLSSAAFSQIRPLALITPEVTE